MNKQVFSYLMLLLPFVGFSQVGVGTNNVDASAKFQIESTNKGFLQPRVALTGTNDVTTIKDPATGKPATGLMVYNTATAGSGTTAITPGVHYFDGSKWVRMESSVINAGTGTTVTGSGTIANPYVVNSTGTPVTFVSGQFASTSEVCCRSYTVNADGVRYTGPSIRIGSITLPEGKWEVNLQTETWPSTLGQLGTTAATQGNCQIKLQFWIQNDGTNNQMVYRFGDQGGRIFNNTTQTIEGYPATGDTLFRNSAAFTFTIKNGSGASGTNGSTDTYDSYCKGSFFINNTSGGNKTYFVYASELIGGCDPSGPNTTGQMPGYFYLRNQNFPSNRLFATKIN